MYQVNLKEILCTKKVENKSKNIIGTDVREQFLMTQDAVN